MYNHCFRKWKSRTFLVQKFAHFYLIDKKWDTFGESNIWLIKSEAFLIKITSRKKKEIMKILELIKLDESSKNSLQDNKHWH